MASWFFPITESRVLYLLQFWCGVLLPPLMLFSQLLVFVVVFPTVLEIQFLLGRLIFTSRSLVTRPVKIDDVPRLLALQGRVIGRQTLSFYRRKCHVTVAAGS